MSKILLIDDDPRLLSLLNDFLVKNDFEVVNAENGKQALIFAKKEVFDLIITDVMMPQMDGNKFIEKLRQTAQTPLLVLTALGEIEDKTTSFDLGADDYMTKPFDPKELILRIKSILKRTKSSEDSIIFGPYSFDTASNILYKNKDVIDLTSSEVLILKLLIKANGDPVSREALSAPLGIDEKGVNVHILRFRKKLDLDENFSYIETVRHRGYRLRIG
ncbi:MAG: response regulator transcription factor [Alphaproteobacteria bacterium]|nr:response regulator transcription factor [Alphaproteobacteria bacterium]